MKKLPILISVGLLAILACLYFLVPSFQNFTRESFDVLTSNDQERIKKWSVQFKLAGPIVLIIVMVVQMFLFVVPNVFVMMVAIIIYGPFWGAVISFAGVFASSTTGYVIGKYLGPITVHKLMSDKAREKTSAFIKRYGVAAIAITRISSLSNDSLSIVAGLLRMNYQKYIAATLAGITPLIVLLAIYGKNGKILKALIWIAVISLVMLIIYIFIVEKKRRKRKPELKRQGIK